MSNEPDVRWVISTRDITAVPGGRLEHDLIEGPQASMVEVVPASRLAEAEAQAVEARVDLMEALEREGALRHDLERARKALAFYAEESNYDYDETAVAYASNKGDVLADNGERARAALAALPGAEKRRE